MATIVSLYEAKTHLSALGERAAQGEEIIVTKHGKPRFRLVSAEVRSARRPPGGGPMQISYLADDFDAPDPEIERLFGTRD
jgi:prevent-host-death family protein